jgi:hypothetical protein
MTAIIIIICIAQIVWNVRLYLKADELAEKEKHLDERANRLAEWEDELINWDKCDKWGK